MIKCNKCEFEANTENILEEHLMEKHKDKAEELLTEGATDNDEEIELEECVENAGGYIQERDCPTPIPENVYI